MARRLRPVGLDFIEVAPVRHVFTAEVAAAPETVYRALAEEVEGWPRWFRAVTVARPTHGGAGREVKLVGGVRFRETIMAADPGQRYAYRVDETNAPGMRALLEEWRLTPSGTGTRVRWTFATDGPKPFRLALAAARPGLGHSFRQAVRALDTRLATRRAAGDR
ncbi:MULTISPECIES: SRPBCC family protein [unclassified Streptomyces]|uniref:SRPBCC family protein n=1 Tax=unclassified Streptomyces TaxID=2593676 RepID=UPI002259441E|nr:MULTISPECIES: SRPBCC family protein [unclassified Streptomyces]MCX4524494.1 SRPBCC family protein [Streptomyces sp. NBC_01551]MCX4544982.1 SRPBCC family protein [Streptomyces sp. NBC_01565]